MATEKTLLTPDDLEQLARNSRLNGTFGFAYTGLTRAYPIPAVQYQDGPGLEPQPEIPAYRHAPPATDINGGWHYTQVPGYFVEAVAGTVTFEYGQLKGELMTRNGGRPPGTSNPFPDFPKDPPTSKVPVYTPIAFSGSYFVNKNLTGCMRSELQFVSKTTNGPIAVDWFFVIVNDWKELRFVAVNSNLRRPVISGSMTRQ